VATCSWFTLHLILFGRNTGALPFLVNRGWRVLVVGNLVKIEPVTVGVKVLRIGFGVQNSCSVFVIVSFASPGSTLSLRCKLIPLVFDIIHKACV
jgi:hypothetical protein